MPTLQKKISTPLDQIKSFTYPKLYTGVEWYVGFMAFDPVLNKLRRKRIKVNFVEGIGARRKYADGLMKRLAKKLEDGWNPWIESENEKAYHTFKDVCDHYRRYITKLEADGILRPDTYRDYTSQLRNIEYTTN